MQDCFKSESEQDSQVPVAVPPNAVSGEQLKFSPLALRQRIETQKELLSATFGQAQAYTNVVIGAGYAGFFAVWAFTREQLTDWQVLWTALLMSISLFVFVAFEVYKSFYMSRSLLSLEQTLADESRFMESLAAWKIENHERQIRFGRMWLRVFWAVLVTGFGAGLILLYAFVDGLVRSYSG